MLALQAPDGTWGGGIYSPKWTSTTYTLLTLCAIGIPRDHAPAQRAAALVLDETSFTSSIGSKSAAVRLGQRWRKFKRQCAYSILSAWHSARRVTLLK